MLVNETVIEELSALILQIGELFSGLYNRMKTLSEPKMAESFDIWFLEVDDLPKALADKSFPVEKRGFQHHQIRLGEKATAYAVSELVSGSHKVIKAALSQVAQRMDRAMVRLDYDDRDKTSKSEARLLVVRACRVYAFWLVEREQVYLFSAPARFKRLQRRRYLKTQTFLRLLNLELAPFQPLAEQPTMRW